MMNYYLLAFSLLMLSPIVAAQKGDITSNESRTMIDEKDYSVVQLTNNKADDAVLYFTNNSYYPSKNLLIFASKRSGNWNLFSIDLVTYNITQLTDSKNIQGIGAALAPETGELFFKDGNQIKSTNLSNLNERIIIDLPHELITTAPISISPNGKLIAIALIENTPIDNNLSEIYSDMDERFGKKPLSTIFTGNNDGSGWHMIANQNAWISHVLISPYNQNTILYCHEGPWRKVAQRMWLIERNNSNNRKLREEESPAISIGHEYFFPNGIQVGYHGNYAPPDNRPFIGVINTINGTYKEYITPTDNMHTHANSTGTLFVSDGNHNFPYISVYSLKDNQLGSIIRFKHNGSWDKQEWHPHPSFLPDNKHIIFTSNVDGNGNIYLLTLKVVN